MTTDQISIFITIGLLVLGLLTAFYVLQRVRGARPENIEPRQPASADAKPEPQASEPQSSKPQAPAPPAETPSPFLPAPSGEPDDLMRIKGIGPKLSARLTELGVFHFTQMAGWTAEQLALVDSQLGTFQGRPERDQWQSQATLLAAGDIKAYERVHGKLGPTA